MGNQPSLKMALHHVFCILLFTATIAACDSSQASAVTKPDADYCVVGAGPGGIQLAYHLHKRNANFRVFERGPGPGTFFKEYPRHRTLISSPPDSHLSNFLHPVVHFFRPGSTTPINTFHILEDLRTDFTQSIHLSPTIAHFKEMLKPLPDMIRAHLVAKSLKDQKCKDSPQGKCEA